MFVQNNTQKENLSFSSLYGIKYAKQNPRLAKAVLAIRDSKAFENLFTDTRFDCFVKLNTTKVRYACDSYGINSYVVPAEKCEINIISKNGKGNIIDNLRAYFDNFCLKYLEKERPSTTFFVNKYDKKNIGTILIQKDDLAERLSKLDENALVRMADAMIAKRKDVLTQSTHDEQYIQEADNAVWDILEKTHLHNKQALKDLNKTSEKI